MTLRKLSVATLLVLGALALAAWLALVPSSPVRPPPAGLAQPVLLPIDIPFTHRWSRDTSHPFLAAAAIDVDGDGRDAVFLGGSDGQPDALIAWRDGALVDIAAQLGIGDTLATYGALSLDMDGDGRIDLLTVGHAGLVLWLNRGGRFERRPIAVDIPADTVPLAASAADVDGDGQVDLYLSMFVAPKQFRSPVFNDPSHAKRNLLLRGLGGGAFENAADAVTAGLQNTFTASFFDLDRDGRPDLVLAQNTGEVEILRNLGGWRFERVALRTGFGFWMGLAFADLHGTGAPDVFFSNSGNSIPGIFIKGDRRDDQPAAHEWLLLRNDGSMRFTDISTPAGVTGFGFAWGGLFEDINLDGALDLLVAENYVKWPVHQWFKLPGKVLLNGSMTAPRFYPSTAGANPSYGHVPLIADLDGDGRNDIVWANMDGQARAYLNRSEGRFVALRLPDIPAAIGARVRLEGTPSATRFMVAGEGLTSDRTTQHMIGLAPGSPAPTALVIEWADGKLTRLANPALGKAIRLNAR